MAILNFLYRSKKENEPLYLRLLFRIKTYPLNFLKKTKQSLEVPYTDFAIVAKTKVNIYSEEELKKEPELSSKNIGQKSTQKNALKILR